MAERRTFIPIPFIRITGQERYGLPLKFAAAGEMANQFEESYGVEIQAKDQAEEGGGQPGLTPHPPNMNYSKGQFDNTQFTVKMFSGMLINDKEIFSGAEIVRHSQILYRLSMPRLDNTENSFVGPPLVHMEYSTFWKAKGIFQKVTFVSEGAFDKEGYPTIVTLRMEFARHFGGQAELGGPYDFASTQDLRAATAQQFSFNQNRRG